MNCTECDREIRRGDKYVSVTRSTERVGRLGAIKVTDAEQIAAYHQACAPVDATARTAS